MAGLERRAQAGRQLKRHRLRQQRQALIAESCVNVVFYQSVRVHTTEREDRRRKRRANQPTTEGSEKAEWATPASTPNPFRRGAGGELRLATRHRMRQPPSSTVVHWPKRGLSRLRTFFRRAFCMLTSELLRAWSGQEFRKRRLFLGSGPRVSHLSGTLSREKRPRCRHEPDQPALDRCRPHGVRTDPACVPRLRRIQPFCAWFGSGSAPAQPKAAGAARPDLALTLPDLA